MKTPLSVASEVLKQDAPMDPSIWRGIGHIQAFGLVSATTQAAAAQAIKKLHDEATHKRLGITWEQFCTECLFMSRATADRMIKDVTEFGVQAYTLKRALALPSADVKQLTGKVELAEDGSGIEIDGEMVPFTKANQAKIRDHVEGLLAKIENTQDEVKDQVNKAAKAEKKAAAAAEQAKKVRAEMADMKRREEELFSDAGPARQRMLRAQSYVTLAVEHLRAAGQMADEAGLAELRSLAAYLVALIIQAADPDSPVEAFQADPPAALNLMAQYTEAAQ